MVDLSLGILFGMLPKLKRQIHESHQLFEDKDLHDLSDLTPQSAPQQNRKNRKEDYSKIHSGHLKSSR